MPDEDATLDQFVGAGDASGDGATDERVAGDATDAAVDTGESADERSARDGPEATRTATPTSAWVPGGRACPDCGERARRLWRHDDGFVCGDCAAWDRGP